MSVSAFPYGNFEDALPLTVTASGNSVSNLRLNATCYAGVTYSSDENEYNNQGDADDSTLDATFIQKLINNGNGEDVWVERTINSGSLNHEDPGAGRHQLSTTRRFGVVRSGVGTESCNLTVNFYDAASGGNLLDTETFGLDAEFTV